MVITWLITILGFPLEVKWERQYSSCHRGWYVIWGALSQLGMLLEANSKVHSDCLRGPPRKGIAWRNLGGTLYKKVFSRQWLHFGRFQLIPSMLQVFRFFTSDRRNYSLVMGKSIILFVPIPIAVTVCHLWLVVMHLWEPTLQLRHLLTVIPDWAMMKCDAPTLKKA